MLLGACGRIGFAPTGGDGSTSGDGDALINAVCGDQVCTAAGGETCHSCSDCVTRTFVCGNLLCDPGETDVTCATDCGPSVWPAAWVTVETDFVTAFNAARTSGRDCATSMNPPVAAVTVAGELTTIARIYAWVGGVENGMSVPCNGATLGDIATDRGITVTGGMFAFGNPTITAQAALDSMFGVDGLCTFSMDPAMTQIGVGFVQSASIGTVNVYLR